jgi:HEAT repeat protein
MRSPIRIGVRKLHRVSKAKRIEARSLPRPLGADHLSRLPLDAVVSALGTPHLARAALWTLVAAGADAVNAVQQGLESSNADVRRGCCQFLDMHGDAEASQAAVRLLDDPDDGVRWWAGHALACERCKAENTWIKRQSHA